MAAWWEMQPPGVLLAGGEEEEAAAVLAALPGRARSEGPAGCGDLGAVAAAVCPLAGGVPPVPIVQGPAPPGAFVRQRGGMGARKNHGWWLRPSHRCQPGPGDVGVLWVTPARSRRAFG